MNTQENGGDMSGENWTPGPWWVGQIRTPIGAAVVTEGYTPANSEREREYYGGNLVAESLTPENANLIAAAPDLYEALDAVLADLRAGGNGGYENLAYAYAALDKARGEET